MSRLLLAMLALSASAAFAHDYVRGHLAIGHPWSRPTAAGVPVGVVYLSITNNGPAEEILLGARSPAAGRVEVHQTVVSEGMARMRPMSQVVIAPGATARIEPGGVHFMLFDLKAPLSPGDRIPFILSFRGAGEVEIEVRVEARDTAGARRPYNTGIAASL
jgi:copper(I)-binding protein